MEGGPEGTAVFIDSAFICDEDWSLEGRSDLSVDLTLSVLEDLLTTIFGSSIIRTSGNARGWSFAPTPRSSLTSSATGENTSTRKQSESLGGVAPLITP